MDLVAIVGVALWALLPAYVPNNAAVLFGGGPPIDGGRTWRGKRLLGDGKTWRGTAAGIAAGALLAVLLTRLAGPASTALGVGLPTFPPAPTLALPTGALLGDIGASFLKRRTGRGRGAAFPGLDQYDLLIGALALSWLVAPSWTTATFEPPVLVAAVVVTPLLHVGTNVVAYWLGLKNEPW